MISSHDMDAMRDDDAPERAMRFIYRNWRGELAERHATPLSIRWGTTEWHPEPGWLMLAFDHRKMAEREFALADCAFPKDVYGNPILDAHEAAIREAREEGRREGVTKSLQSVLSAVYHHERDADVAYCAIRGDVA